MTHFYQTLVAKIYDCPIHGMIMFAVWFDIITLLLAVIFAFFIVPFFTNKRLDPHFRNETYLNANQLYFSAPNFPNYAVRCLVYCRAAAFRNGYRSAWGPGTLRMRPRPYLSQATIYLCKVCWSLWVIAIPLFVILGAYVFAAKIHDGFYGFKPALGFCASSEHR